MFFRKERGKESFVPVEYGVSPTHHPRPFTKTLKNFVSKMCHTVSILQDVCRRRPSHPTIRRPLTYPPERLVRNSSTAQIRRPTFSEVSVDFWFVLKKSYLDTADLSQ